MSTVRKPAAKRAKSIQATPREKVTDMDVAIQLHMSPDSKQKMSQAFSLVESI
jgi:hypothetical protein